jgi:hypothetical protein
MLNLVERKETARLEKVKRRYSAEGCILYGRRDLSNYTEELSEHL